jgi:hypothetical protein
MPGCMAHYQFGQDILNTLNFTLRQLVTAYKNEFDIGLQGPDIFFTYQMLKNPGLLRYGLKWHACSANRMFAPLFREKPKMASSFAYTLGLLCHYFLDSACHPYIFGRCGSLPEHWKMEAAYDKAIMRRYAYGAERYPYLPVTMLDYTGIAIIWPGVNERTVETSIRAAHVLKRVLDTKRALIVLGKVCTAYGKLCFQNDAELMTKEQAQREKSLDRLYGRALADGSEMIETIFHGVGREQPQYERFKVNFFGEKVEA